MNKGERLRLLRLSKKITQTELANKLNTTKQTISKYEKGIVTNIPSDRVEELARILETTPEYILGWDEDTPQISNLIPCPPTRQVPVIGAIACGTPILAEQNVDGYAVMPEHVQADFALRCVGDSMIGARICDGDIVYIRKTYDFQNGDICAVLVEDEATLKRVYRISDSLVELRAENPSYPILRYQGQDAAAVRIIGKAVAFTSAVRH